MITRPVFTSYQVLWNTTLPLTPPLLSLAHHNNHWRLITYVRQVGREMVPSVFPNPHYSTMARITYHAAEEALAFCPHLDLSRQLPNAARAGETHKEGLSMAVVVCGCLRVVCSAKARARLGTTRRWRAGQLDRRRRHHHRHHHRHLHRRHYRQHYQTIVVLITTTILRTIPCWPSPSITLVSSLFLSATVRRNLGIKILWLINDE